MAVLWRGSWRMASPARIVPGVSKPALDHFDEVFKFIQRLGLFFQFEQRFQFGTNQGELELAVLAAENIFDIHPVNASSGKDFVDNEVFGRTGPQPLIRRIPHGGPLDRPLFEGKSPESNVDVNCLSGLDEKHTVLQRKFESIGSAGGKLKQKLFYESLFLTETGDQRQVDILREARDSPPLHGYSTDKAEIPSLPLNEILNLYRPAQNLFEG
jgi:hypothetical protein